MNKHDAILSDPKVRRSMKYRRAGYYYCFDVGKAVGYIPKKSGPGRWAARVTQHRKLYREESFASADDYEQSDGATILTFAEAKVRAEELCSRPHLTKNFSAETFTPSGTRSLSMSSGSAPMGLRPRLKPR